MFSYLRSSYLAATRPVHLTSQLEFSFTLLSNVTSQRGYLREVSVSCKLEATLMHANLGECGVLSEADLLKYLPMWVSFQLRIVHQSFEHP